MTESSIESSFLRWCKKVRKWSVKLRLTVGKGWPDHAVLLPGNRVCWIEFKTDAGRLSPVQEYTIREMAKHGHTVFVCRSSSEAQNAIARLSAGGEGLCPTESSEP